MHIVVFAEGAQEPPPVDFCKPGSGAPPYRSLTAGSNFGNICAFELKSKYNNQINRLY